MGELVKVGMADLKVCKAPTALTTLGLGSCIGCCIYDPSTKIIGMVHFMLPDSTRISNNSNIAKFGDTGIAETVKQMVAMGANKARMVAKIAGGAKMFTMSASANMPSLNVGDNNTASAKENLKKLGIRIIAEDTGLDYGRTIEFYPEDGKLIIKSVGKPVKTI